MGGIGNERDVVSMTPTYLVGQDGRPFLDEERAVAEMLESGALVLSEQAWGYPVTVEVNLNDIFVAGADSAPLARHMIERMYWAHCDPRPGAMVEWLCEHYGDRPWRERV